MSTITVQRIRTAQAPILRLAPQYPSTGAGSRELSQHTAHDLIKVLDPSAPAKYTAAHSPPAARVPAPAATKKDVPELPDVLDTQIHDLIQQTIADRDVADGGDESSFFAADLSAVYQAVKMWRDSPMGDRVEIFYAAKCCPTVPVLHLLSLLGCSFDCASTNEFQQVLALPSAPKPDRIIFANPCKAPSMIRAAAEAGVEMMTFDNADELYKVKRAYPNAKLVLRILTDDAKSLCRLGLKYGAPLETCPGLLALARQLDLNVVGVSFHVGSGCKDPNQFADAVWRSKKVFDMAKEAGYELNLLDIGGGFERETFAEMSEVVSDSLDVYFPKSSGVRVIAEPGRLLVSSAFTLATNIIARRRALEPAPVQCEADSDGADVMYYINDGVYGSFNCIMFDHQIVHPYPLTINHQSTTAVPPFPPPPNVHLAVDLPVQLGYTQTEKASVWGPTCDSLDCVRQVVRLPSGLAVGDWLGWAEMGAYTLCAASTFNGMNKSPVLWTTGGNSSDARAVRQILDSFKPSVR